MSDFTAVTEVTGSRATSEQLSMIQTRYVEAARLAGGRRVLEVACGPGRGLGMLARHAQLVVGGDYMLPLVEQGARHYGARIPVLPFDAQAMPFASQSFDLVILFEAIYYLPDADRFLAECRRVLSPGGTVFICSANREWSEFTTSSFAMRYYSAAELRGLLEQHGFDVRVMAAFETGAVSALGRAISLMRRVAVALHLVPTTLAGREWLKRCFYGPLRVLGPEVIEGEAAAEPLKPVDPATPVEHFKVLYAFGTLRDRPVV